MKRRIRQLLEQAELSEEEIRLYLMLLQCSSATASELIECSGLNRMAVYRALGRLENRGLLNVTPVNKKQLRYAPLALSPLITRLEKEQKSLRRLQLALEDLDSLLPYMNDLDHDIDEPVEILEGLDSFRSEYFKLPEQCNEEFLHLGSMEHYWNAAGMSDEAPEELAFRAKRYARGVYARVLDLRTPGMEEVGKRDSKELRTLRMCSKLPIQRDYIAFANTYLCHFICDKDNPRTIIIRHPELVALHKQQFQTLWKKGVGVS